MPIRGLFLPRRVDAPRQARNVSAWEGLRAFSQKNGRFRRNVPAWERSGRARSRLGRDGEKGHRAYLRKRRGSPLPEPAYFSQAETMCRNAADSVLQQQRFSQARTMCQFCDATPLLGRSAGARREASLPRRVDGQPWFAHCLRLEGRCAYTRKTGAWDETRPGKGKEEQGQAWKRNEATRKAEPLLPVLCGLAAGAENYLK